MVVNGVFYIPSSALLPGIAKIVLKDNELFAVLDTCGDSPRIYDRELGFYVRDTRYLDVWELSINGEGATSLTTEPADGARGYVFVMTNRDITSSDYGGRLPRDKLGIQRVVSLEDDQVFEHVQVTNYDNVPHTVELTRRAASRFDDVFEVRGAVRKARGALRRPELSADRHLVTLSYEGLDRRIYRTRIWSVLPLAELTVDDGTVMLKHSLTLVPGSALTLKYVVAFDRDPLPLLGGRNFAAMPIEEHLRHVNRSGSNRLAMPQIVTDNQAISHALAVAGADLSALLTRRGDHLYPDAGIPWFCAPFGRDGLITAYQLLPWQPEVARGVLAVALSSLGKKTDAYTDEEPGKVFHEQRYGEMARQAEIPFIPYYGAVDATPLCLTLLGEYAAWTNDFATVRHYWEQARAALDWVRRNIATSKHGFVTYQAALPTGLSNQGWKDSHDSVMHADGTLAVTPIALCEVQAYAYRALRTMAELGRAIGLGADSDTWLAEAEALRERFVAAFWDNDRHMVVLALGGDGRPCRVLSSNQGHCLWAGLIEGALAKNVAGHLLSEAMFTGYGIRTLASTEVAYNPLSYHNGSVWPHDNALIAEGLRRADCLAELTQLASGMLSTVEAVADGRLPELFCGFGRFGRGAPVPYDVACKPQAWAAGAIFLLLKALLGMSTRLGDDRLYFRTPVLPAELRSLVIKHLPVHGGEVDLEIRGGTTSCTVEVQRKTGQTRVAVLS